MKYNDLKIFCHTYGRPHRKLTVQRLPPRLRKRTWLVVQDREKHEYSYPRLMVLPKKIKMLSPTRQYIIENAECKKIVIMDDDISFLRRKNPEDVRDWHMKPCDRQDTYDMFDMILEHLDTYLHCGISDRLKNNKLASIKNARLYKECDRMMRFLAYDLTKLRKTGARFDRVDLKQDLDMTLQLLRAGHKNIVSYEYAINQTAGSNVRGGCSEYRTPEMMKRCAVELAKLHPGFVRVRRVKLESSWESFGNERIDVRVRWGEAFRSSAGYKPKGALI